MCSKRRMKLGKPTDHYILVGFPDLICYWTGIKCSVFISGWDKRHSWSIQFFHYGMYFVKQISRKSTWIFTITIQTPCGGQIKKKRFSTHEDGNVGCPETSIRNYYYSLRNNWQGRSSKSLRCPLYCRLDVTEHSSNFSGFDFFVHPTLT